MAIASPNENVYYYECSNGRFRLSYFIPPGEIKALCDEKLISRNALKDFPDGVDVGCTEADFKVFKETYGYGIRLDPQALQRAFFAIFSTTRNWKKFRGSGFIPAADLERHLDKVDGTLRKERKTRKVVEPPPGKLSLKQLRQRRRQEGIVGAQTHNVLRKLQVEGIDPDRTLHEQEFSSVNMAKGAGAEEVFIRLHQKHRKGE